MPVLRWTHRQKHPSHSAQTFTMNVSTRHLLFAFVLSVIPVMFGQSNPTVPAHNKTDIPATTTSTITTLPTIHHYVVILNNRYHTQWRTTHKAHWHTYPTNLYEWLDSGDNCFQNLYYLLLFSLYLFIVSLVEVIVCILSRGPMYFL